MLRFSLITLCPILLAMGVVPATYLAGTVGQSDGSNLYMVLETAPLDSLPAGLSNMGVREIGPERSAFARMMYANPAAHGALVKSGYWVIPASALAALCGASIEIET